MVELLPQYFCQDHGVRSVPYIMSRVTWMHAWVIDLFFAPHELHARQMHQAADLYMYATVYIVLFRTTVLYTDFIFVHATIAVFFYLVSTLLYIVDI